MKRIVLIALITAATTVQAETKSGIADYFKGPDEPTVKDALWTSENMFKVGVLPDGSRRDGFAGYVCQVLIDSGFGNIRNLRVEVIDIQKLVSDDKWVTIGSARCS